MALATHQLQGSYNTFSSRPLSWSNSSVLKQSVTTLHSVNRKDRFAPLKCKSCLKLGASLVPVAKYKPLKISAFKGNGQNVESAGRASGSKSLKNSVKLSYVPQDSEDTIAESSKVQKVPVSYPSEADEATTRSAAIQNLFKNWLMILRTPSTNQSIDETIEETSSTAISETQSLVEGKEQREVLKAVWSFFLGLDATIKIPLLMFIPWYLAVNLIYGPEVSRELAPLWIFGPLVVALYIKLFRGICALYVFSFKQTVKVVRNAPTYYLATYSYVASGKLKQDIKARFFQPVIDIKNLDYKEVSERKLKDLQVFLVEKYLDFVESIWPYYCRMIRFLKRANLI